MCSFGARLLRGEASSSICGTTMMDSLSNTSKGVQAVGSSLATALRDRQAYVIPIQPNRSLPVRPAPHHTPCRTTIARSSFSRPTSFVIRTLQPLVVEAPAKCEATAIEQVDTSTKQPEENLEEEKSDKSEKPLISREEKTEEGISNSKESSEENSSEMKRNFRGDIHNFVRTSDSRLIDISQSPERIELDLGSDEVTIYPTNEVTSPEFWGDETSLKEKRKRRRKGVKRTMEDVRDDFLSNFAETGCRTVPPLRLKKIQTLQEPVASCGPSWQGIAREIDDSTFAMNAGSMSNPKKLRNECCTEFGGAKEYSSKYRIVTGHTPPYEDCIIDSSSSTEPRIDSLDAAKLRYRQTKLKIKLRELRRKTVDLGKEMLRSVLTSSTGPRASRLRQTINRNEEQIEDLEKLLNVIPKAAGYVDEVEEIEWQNYADTTKIIAEEETEQSLDFSPVRTRSSSTSSSMCSSPSLEPPKLSPRSPTNYEAARSPSDVRNSPPVLPRVYVTVADCRGHSWDGRNNSSRRRRVKRRARSPGKKEIVLESPVISTTMKTVVKDKTESIDTSENSNSTEKNFIEVGKTDLESISCNSVDALEFYDSAKSPKETKNCIDRAEDIKSLVKRSSSPEQPVEIDTTSVDTDFDAKPQFLEEISEIPINDFTKVESTSISSTCEIAREDDEARNEEEIKEVVTVRDEVVEEPQQSGNGLTIDEQFPTLGNWIARLSKKQVGVTEANTRLPEAAAVENRPSAFQQVFSAETNKPATPEVLQNSTPTIVHENVVTPQWRNESWQEQQDQQQPLTGSYASTLPVPPPPPPPQLGQEFCSPITMARLYTRNYAIDPYSVAYGYNPAIAAAAATTSLWNSAAILQYPLLRHNSSMLNSQPSRMQSSNLPFPTGTAGLRQAYRGMQQTTEAKRSVVDSSNNNYGQREAKLMSAEISTTYEQSKRANSSFQNAVNAGQARLSCNNVNSREMNYRTCLQQQQQQQQFQEQQQFARATCADSSMRLPVPASMWRSGHVIGTMGTGCNYNGTSGWPAISGNILNSLSRTSTPSFVPPSSVLSMNSSRTRTAKESIDGNLRNCETPHLGKVAYSPNTVNNLECSNCGLAGSMFKCLGCEVAFYCNENCQVRHWNRHVISCPKKMPKLKKLVH